VRNGNSQEKSIKFSFGEVGRGAPQNLPPKIPILESTTLIAVFVGT
jgi:hypothetical protein